MDISKLTTQELEKLLARIPEEMQQRKPQEKTELLKEITQMAAKRGFSLEELVGKAAHIPKTEKTLTRKSVAVKYRHPQEPQLTWTGRGRKPKWVAAWLAQGEKLADLAV